MTNAEAERAWSDEGVRVALVVCLLAIIVYLPSLSLPFLSDDYPHTYLARQYGPLSGWPSLAADVLHRFRATSLILTYWTERVFGLNPLAFHLTGLALHLLNVWLIFALGRWRVIGPRHAAVAAGFFAVNEALHEAVIWYAAIHDLIHLTFALLLVHCWLRWLASGTMMLYSGCAGLFILALLSKESAVALVPLLVLVSVLDGRGWRRTLASLLPFAGLAAAYFFLSHGARQARLEFSGAGMFSLGAAFWTTLAEGAARLFWFWGWLALAALLLWRPAGHIRVAVLGVAWSVIALLPSSLLTHMQGVPSRHICLAAVGLALAVSAGFWRVRERFAKRRWVGWAVLAAVFFYNCAYIWIVKQARFLERAAPTEELVRFAAEVEGPVYIHCFPHGVESAVRAVQVRLGKAAYPILSERPLSEIRDRSNVFCWRPMEHWGRDEAPEDGRGAARGGAR